MIDPFGISFSSSLLFILAGILIGHLLWFQDRSGTEQHLDRLQRRYFKARGGVGRRKREFVRLRKTSAVQLDDLQNIRAQQAALLKQKSELERDYRDALDEVDGMRAANHDLNQRLAAETARAESVIAQLKEVLQSRADGAQVRRARQGGSEPLPAGQPQRVRELELREAALDQQAQALAATRQELAQRSAQVAALQTANAATREELVRTQRQLETALRQLDELRSGALKQDGLAEELESAVISLAQQRELLTMREQELAEVRQALAESRRQMSDVRGAAARAPQPASELRRRPAESETSAIQQQVQDLLQSAEWDLRRGELRHASLLAEQDRAERERLRAAEADATAKNHQPPGEMGQRREVPPPRKAA